MILLQYKTHTNISVSKINIHKSSLANVFTIAYKTNLQSRSFILNYQASLVNLKHIQDVTLKVPPSLTFKQLIAVKTHFGTCYWLDLSTF